VAKNIVFCADGTWNGPGQDLEGDRVSCDPTNVLKLYHWLDGKDTLASLGVPAEAERILRDSDGKLLQVAKYLDGVGNNDNWLSKVLGGVFGSGIIARIVRGYTFISRHYEKDDKIFLIGFSRGAYTARSLAGMILDVGLLDARHNNLDDKEAAYRLGCAMWNRHRETPRVANAQPGALDHIRGLLRDLPAFFSAPPANIEVIKDVRIEAVAVWDTVGALGIPVYSNETGRLDAFQFCNTRLSDDVTIGLHAISNDELRKDFTPSIWDPAPNVRQVRLHGAHADVGGGYPLHGGQSGLSDVALQWMQNQLRDMLRFSTMPEGIRPDPNGKIHTPWKELPFSQLGTYQRKFQQRPDILMYP
jgi:uncharacterized protein (DUF2235 family)